jgi:hypothetical protein
MHGMLGGMLGGASTLNKKTFMDNLLFWLHYKATSTLLIAVAIITSGYLLAPIHCTLPGIESGKFFAVRT